MTKMRTARQRRRQEKQALKAASERVCWRCGEVVGVTFGEAILVVAWADDSYSGAFHVPLCDGCLAHPHQAGLDPIMGGAVAAPAGWVYDRLEEDRVERSKKS